MGSLVEGTLSVHPVVEIAVRRAYWNSPRLHSLLAKKGPALSAPAIECTTEALPGLVTALRSMGVVPGDILVIHSSNDALARLALRPRSVNEALLDLIQPGGTLALPTYPILKDEPGGFEYMHPQGPLPTMRFNVRKTPPWTGVLGLDLMRTAGSVRSCLPINTLTAIGFEAEQMFAHELHSSIPYPCGSGSSWAYLASRNAKVVALGVDLAHSLTLNHVAEDLDPDQWPVRDWYRMRDYETGVGSSTIRGRLWERHPRWSQYYAERTLARDLVRDGVAQCSHVGGITIQLLAAQDHLEYLQSRREPTYPYFYIPRKYRRETL